MAQCALLVSGQRPYNNLSHFTADLFWGTRGFAWLMVLDGHSLRALAMVFLGDPFSPISWDMVFF